MSNRTDQLEAREAALEDELERRDTRSATERQIMAARGHLGGPTEPEYKPETEWSTTERQIHAHYGRKPLKGD